MEKEKMKEKEAPATFSIQFSRIGFSFLYRLRRWIKSQVPASDSFAIYCLLNRDFTKETITSCIEQDEDFLDLNVSSMYVNQIGQCSSIHECGKSKNLVYFFAHPEMDRPFTELMTGLMTYIQDTKQYHDRDFIGVYLGKGTVRYLDICGENLSAGSFNNIYRILEESKIHGGICIPVPERFNKSLKINPCFLQVREGLRFSYDASMVDFIINTNAQIRNYRDFKKSEDVQKAVEDLKTIKDTGRQMAKDLKDRMIKELEQAEYAFPPVNAVKKDASPESKEEDSPKDEEPFGILGIENFDDRGIFQRTAGWVNRLLESESFNNSKAVIILVDDIIELLEERIAPHLVSMKTFFDKETEIYLIDDPDKFYMTILPDEKPRLRIFFIRPKEFIHSSLFRTTMNGVSIVKDFAERLGISNGLMGIWFNLRSDIGEFSPFAPSPYKALDEIEYQMIISICEMMGVNMLFSVCTEEIEKDIKFLPNQFIKYVISNIIADYVDGSGSAVYSKYISTKTN